MGCVESRELVKSLGSFESEYTGSRKGAEISVTNSSVAGPA